MRDALPQASFIGFTGTPIALEDRDTRGVFGDYVSIYDIQDAVDDKATVPIYYESRLAKLDINREEIDALNQDVEEVIEDEEDVAARETVKSKWTQLAKLVGAQPRLEEVARDFVTHFETRAGALEGKAMFVAMSRDICVSLFEDIHHEGISRENRPESCLQKFSAVFENGHEGRSEQAMGTNQDIR